MFIENITKDPFTFWGTLAVIPISVCLHELAHGYAAIKQGDDTPRETGHMTLDPMVHMGIPSLICLLLFGICWGAMPINPSRFKNPKLGHIIVSVAGPLSNLAIAFILGNLCFISQKVLPNSGFADGVFKLLLLGSSYNFILFMFNLMPVPPLDGFHIISNIIPSLRSLEQSMVGIILFLIVFNSDGFWNVVWGISYFFLSLIGRLYSL